MTTIDETYPTGNTLSMEFVHENHLGSGHPTGIRKWLFGSGQNRLVRRPVTFESVDGIGVSQRDPDVVEAVE